MSKQAVKQWENRIVGHGEESPENLLANPLNFRVHPKRQQDALQGVLDEVGVVDEVIVNQRTGFLVNGHLRVSLAMRTNQPAIPVKYVDLSESEEALILATFDPISALATTDKAKLDEILADVQTGSAAVQEMLAGLAESAGLYQEKPIGAGGDEFDTAPEEGPTRTQLGDLWQLGEHRLFVGDCTVAENVARLMDGARAAICFTSPPYNAGDSEQLTNNTHTSTTKYVLGNSDDLSDDQYLTMMLGFAAAALAVCDFVMMNIQSLAGNKRALIAFLTRLQHYFADKAVWIKSNPQPAMARRVMTSQFEEIWIFSSKQQPTRAVGTNDFRGTVSNVYQSAAAVNVEFSSIHAATFPVHFAEWGVSSFTNRNELVLDSFLGTGTTLIACERLNRKCYGCEIEPKYADVILRRWEAESGKEAVLLERLPNDSTL